MSDYGFDDYDEEHYEEEENEYRPQPSVPATVPSGASLRPAASASSDPNRPFDNLNNIRDEKDEKQSADEKQEQPLDPRSGRQFDFRHGKLPTGVTVCGEASLEVQQDKSTALSLKPKTFLKLDLNLPCNGGGKFINNYTITMDIKVSQLPKDSLSLFSSRWPEQASEGEAYLSKNGGVGCFGEFGVSSAFLKPNRWTRIVITVGGTSSAPRGSTDPTRRMNTYVNSKPCAVVDKPIFKNSDNRFALNPQYIHLFTSSNEKFTCNMEDYVQIKYVEVRPYAMTKEEVKETANLNKIYSWWEIEKEEAERKMHASLTLHSLYKKPPPIWVHPCFLGVFGDAFVEGTSLEGGRIDTCVNVLDIVWKRMIKEQRILLENNKNNNISLQQQEQTLEYVGSLLTDASKLFRSFVLAMQNTTQALHFIRNFRNVCSTLKEGEFVLVPGGIGGHPLIYIIEKLSDVFSSDNANGQNKEAMYRFVVVNTHPLAGLQYHPTSGAEAPKLKYKTSLVVDAVPASKLINDAFWCFVWKLICVPSKTQNTPDKLYELLLQYLMDKPLHHAYVATLNDNTIPFRSPQRSSTAYYRCLYESLLFILYRKGLSVDVVKRVGLCLRLQMLQCAFEDLAFVGELSDSDLRVLRIAAQQCAYATVKLSEKKIKDDSNETIVGVDECALVKQRVDELEACLTQKDPSQQQRADEFEPVYNMEESENTRAPPKLTLVDDAKTSVAQPFTHLLFDRLQRKEGVEGLVGLPLKIPRYVPVDFTLLPTQVTNFEEALAALRYADKLCTLISVQKQFIKNSEFLKVSLLQYLFTQLLPVPRGLVTQSASLTAAPPCLWATPLRYGVQLDALILLQRLMEHFASSVFGLQNSKSLDAVKIIVSGAMVVIADAIIRKKATDIPSELCLNLMGFEGLPAYQVSIGSFHEQTETIEIHNPHLALTRTHICDYFASFTPSRSGQVVHPIFEFEKTQAPEQHTMAFLEQLCGQLAFDLNDVFLYVCGESQRHPHHLVVKNYPEFICYRDVCFYWKFFMNVDMRAFPPVAAWHQQHAQLRWNFDDGIYVVTAYERMPLFCKPQKPLETAAGNVFPTHRYPSGCSPSLLCLPHANIQTEDDILHIKNLPTFQDSFSQRDSELFLSYLTTPYLRVHLCLLFFVTNEERIHTLKSPKVQALLDAAVFEPWRLCQLGDEDKEPTHVPITHLSPSEEQKKMSTPYGLLLNECVHVHTYAYEQSFLYGVVRLLKLAQTLDTGTVFSSTTDIILYVVRFACRIENFLAFLIAYNNNTHPTTNRQHVPLRIPPLSKEVLTLLERGLDDIRRELRGPILTILELYCEQAMQAAQQRKQLSEQEEEKKKTEAKKQQPQQPAKVKESKVDPLASEQKQKSSSIFSKEQEDSRRPTYKRTKEEENAMDEYTRLACNIQAHFLLIYRNLHQPQELSPNVASLLLCAFLFLTTRHSFNMNNLLLPEFELFEAYTHIRRILIVFMRSCSQSKLDLVCESVVRVCTNTGKRKESLDRTQVTAIEFLRRWAYVQGDRNIGRFTVASAKLKRQLSYEREKQRRLQKLQRSEFEEDEEEKVGSISDREELGVELDLQTIQLTLKSSHLHALETEIATNEDVVEVFGSSMTMQAATLESTEHRTWLRLVGRDHDLYYWKTPDKRTAMQFLDREYSPGDLFPQEEWIVPILEPVRLTYCTRPFVLQLMMPEEPLSKDADVAYLIGLHPKLGGTWKEFYVFKHTRTVHVYDVMSHGRRFYRSLVYTNDVRWCLHDMQPSLDDRQTLWPSWERHGAGHPYQSYPNPLSCVITRHRALPANLSGTEETFIPARLLQGLVPTALLEAYRFWQDERDNLRGYPVDAHTHPHMIYIELFEREKTRAFQTAGVCARIYRVPLQRVHEFMESLRTGQQQSQQKAKTLDDEILVLLNPLYAPPNSRLFSLARTLVRMENLSYILIWSKCRHDEKDNIDYSIDLVDLPRLKMAFHAKLDEESGEVRLYSMDHVDLFVSNERSSLTSTLIRNIPHSLLLSNANKEIFVLVPAWRAVRPNIGAAPFSTELVMYRQDVEWLSKLDTRYFLYPVHVSLSFMFTPTLASALYLLLMRFFARNYDEVFKLSNTIATDTAFTQEEGMIFEDLQLVANDFHPNAHACRLQISLVTVDSPVDCPWDLTKQMSRYVTKLGHVSATCRLKEEDELQLMEKCITDVNDPRFDPRVYTEYEIVLCKNRRNWLQAHAVGGASCAVSYPSDVPSIFTNWTTYADASCITATPDKWQQLAVFAALPQQVQGEMIFNIIHQFFESGEDTSGATLKLGFLFLYGLFSGSIKAKVAANDDSRTFAILLTQLLVDARQSSLFSSILNVLIHNPQLAAEKKLPLFKDKRQYKNERITGWVDEREKSSPLDELFSTLIPTLQAEFLTLRYAQPALAMQKPPPVATCPIKAPLRARWSHAPQLTDFACDERVLAVLDGKLLGCSALSVPVEKIRQFAEQPLSELDLSQFVVQQTREERGLPPVDPTMPFDVSKHSQAKSEVARSMMSRLEQDMQAYAEQENNGKIGRIVKLLESNVRALVDGDENVADAVAVVNQLLSTLFAIKANDTNFVLTALPWLTNTANEVELPQQQDADVLSRYRFLLNRYCGQDSKLPLDFLIGSLLSSKASDDLLAVNPYLPQGKQQQLMNVAVVTLLFANRIGQINRAINDARDLLSILTKVKKLQQQKEQMKQQHLVIESNLKLASDTTALWAGLSQKSESLARNLTMKRWYIDNRNAAGDFILDPRFLVFEFTWNILLRKNQVVVVRDFMASMNRGESSVKQMLMGQGKSTVVSPLLSLMLADGKHLLTIVVPPALLEFSRSIMRSTFSSIMMKRIYTLSFDRSSKIEPQMYRKLQHCAKSSGITVTTPTAVKSIMLKYIETLCCIEDESRPRSPELENDARQLRDVLALFREGTLIADEVDLILHPLRSELNFPIGEKLDLDFSPLRWKLPIHLLDSVFYAAAQANQDDTSANGNNKSKKITASVGFRESTRARKILDQFTTVVKKGYEARALQRNPHIVLLNPKFYHEEMKPILCEWLMLFLESQHVSGLSEDQIRTYVLEGATYNEELSQLVNNSDKLTPTHKKLLNLSRDWLKSYMPHVLSKIDRVTFGLLTEEDLKRALQQDPHMPRSRAKLAVPFVGKDVPSRSSEFAHPDVIIGLTILGYRYEGLRTSDFNDVITHLRTTLTREIGPYNLRKSAMRYARWVKEAGGRIRGERAIEAQELENEKENEREQKGSDRDDSEDEEDSKKEDEVVEVVPLRLLKRSNEDQMEALFKLLYKLPDLIHWYLMEFIFPAFMRHQIIKLQASGQALGGAMLFPRRIGFSGTPSDLLPVELGKCGYEKGTDGQIMSTLTNPNIVSFELIEEGWTPHSLLLKIAKSQPPLQFNALIDTGALITGLSNYEVAKFLLDNGLEGIDGVVFLDEFDRKMILVRATGRVLPLAQCGIPATRRFAFYDQIHTTGMDIQHKLDARAVVTLGKDLVFRDYAQGSYRMRGIGVGQTIHLFIIPEIERLIRRELNEAHFQHIVKAITTTTTTTSSSSPNSPASFAPMQLARSTSSNFTSALTLASSFLNAHEDIHRQVLIEVAAWLVINSMRSERIQFNMLCMQNVANVWRKHAFSMLLHQCGTFRISQPLADSRLKEALALFREPIDFTVEASVPKPRLFSKTIENMIEKHGEFIITEEDKFITTRVKQMVSGFIEEASHVLDAEMVQEQEEEKERQQEQEQEQEIEIEKYVDLAYSRDHEEPTPWPFSMLADFEKAKEMFYPSSEFKLYKRQPLPLPDSLLVSNNYFDKRWGGARRIKNVVMLLEWSPSLAQLQLKSPPNATLSPAQEKTLQKAFSLFDGDQSGGLNSVEAALLIRAAFDFKPTEQEVQNILKEYADKNSGEINFANLRHFLLSRLLQPEETPHYFVIISLAEAATIRRILHVRQGRPAIDNKDTIVGLRCSAAENTLIDVSKDFRAAPAFQASLCWQSARFVDCDTFYSEPQINVLLFALKHATIRERIKFFQQIIGCRRRLARKWEETPLAKVFSLADEYSLLKQRAQSVCVRHALKNKGLLLYDAFRMFDSDRNGLLSAAELWGAFDWLGLTQVDAEDVLEFMKTGDADRDDNLNYREFVDMIRDPDASLEELEQESQSNESSEGALSPASPRHANETALQRARRATQIQRVKPKGEEELRALRDRINAEEKAFEEDEAKREKAEDERIRSELAAEEEEEDKKQEGGRNPSIEVLNEGTALEVGKIRYDFTTGKRPRHVQTAGDQSYQDDTSGKKFLKLFPLGLLYLPVPFPTNAKQPQPINQYTVTMELKLDDLPRSPQVLFMTTRGNTADLEGKFYIQRDGSIGIEGGGETLQQDKNLRLRKDKWHVVSVSVDCTEGFLNIYIDGKHAHGLLSPQIEEGGKFAIYKEVVVLGCPYSPAVLAGGLVRQLSEERSKESAARAITSAANAMAVTSSSSLLPPISPATMANLKPRDAQAVSESNGGNLRLVVVETRNLGSDEIAELYQHIQEEGAWSCETCTVRNPGSATTCSVCGSIRPTAAAAMWSCPVCTLNNSASSPVCAACETPKP